MVRATEHHFSPEPSLGERFPEEMAILRTFLEQGPPRTQEERIAARRAFRDAGLFDALNARRENLGEEPLESVAEASWQQMAETIQESEDALVRFNRERSAEYEAWLAKVEERDAEEAAEAEARRVEGKGYEKFQPMSQGPKEDRKYYKHLPTEYRPMFKKEVRIGGPIEMDPREYQSLRKKRSEAIGRAVAEAIVERKLFLAQRWLEKRYEGFDIKFSELNRALEVGRTDRVRTEDVEAAWQAAEQQIDAKELEHLRRDATYRYEGRTGFHKIPRERTEKKRSWKKIRGDQHISE